MSIKVISANLFTIIYMLHLNLSPLFGLLLRLDRLYFVQYPKGMKNINMICENGILLYVNYGYKCQSFHNNIHVTSKFISSFWSPLAFGPTVVPSAHEFLKNVTRLWKINKNDKIPLPESP
jgi:hypothetical protein